jgi:hypothetical protein
MTRFSTVALACAFAFSSTSALAASQASASIGNMSFTLVDLDPFDNIAPSMSFLTTSGSTALSVSATDTALGESEASSRTRPGTFSFSNQFLAQLTNSASSASVSDSALTVQGVANGPGTAFNASASTGGVSSYYATGPLTISISANTALLINADLSLSAAASNSNCSSYYYYCNSSDYATATGSLALAYNYAGNGASVSYNQTDSSSITATATGSYTTSSYEYDPTVGYYRYVYTTVPGADDAKSLTDVLSGKFVNMSNQVQSASLGISVSINGVATSAALVPEPGTMGLTALGLAAVGAAATRAGAVSAVPEPGSAILSLMGFAGLSALVRRRRAT